MILALIPGVIIPTILGVPIDFILFAAILLGVAIFHHHTLRVALIGLATIIAYKLLITGFKTGPGIGGLVGHFRQEWVMLTNLFLLLIGFGLLSRHFEKSRIPAVLPRILPHDWKGALWLLVMVFILSSFLDNIAAGIARPEILASYPSLRPEDIDAALAYAAELAREGAMDLPAELTA